MHVLRVLCYFELNNPWYEKHHVNIPMISFCVQQKQESHAGLDQHGGEQSKCQHIFPF